MNCTICGSPCSPATVERQWKPLKRISRRKFWATHIQTDSGTSMLLLCTKRKTHMISRKLCYEYGLIRRPAQPSIKRGGI